MSEEECSFTPMDWIFSGLRLGPAADVCAPIKIKVQISVPRVATIHRKIEGNTKTTKTPLLASLASRSNMLMC